MIRQKRVEEREGKKGRRRRGGVESDREKGEGRRGGKERAIERVSNGGGKGDGVQRGLMGERKRL